MRVAVLLSSESDDQAGWNATQEARASSSKGKPPITRFAILARLRKVDLLDFESSNLEE
jgi:hypothetical protein